MTTTPTRVFIARLAGVAVFDPAELASVPQDLSPKRRAEVASALKER